MPKGKRKSPAKGTKKTRPPVDCRSLTFVRTEPGGHSGQQAIYLCPECDDDTGNFAVDVKLAWGKCWKCGFSTVVSPEVSPPEELGGETKESGWKTSGHPLGPGAWYDRYIAHRLPGINSLGVANRFNLQSALKNGVSCGIFVPCVPEGTYQVLKLPAPPRGMQLPIPEGYETHGKNAMIIHNTGGDINRVVLVEGMFDAFALSEVAEKWVVALLGSDMNNEKRARVLELQPREFMVWLDPDMLHKAERIAAELALYIPDGKVINVTSFIQRHYTGIHEQNYDPADIVKNYGVDLLRTIYWEAVGVHYGESQ
jgi:5S rRNA maturation endonuclease (ribonuclease M5)